MGWWGSSHRHLICILLTRKEADDAPVLGSHTATRRSSLAVATKDPSGATATQAGRDGGGVICADAMFRGLGRGHIP